ncbi:hypothetical protein L226DRAFT_502003 [Lentinus tigrinus ALCF2SS1-7]|uniref:Uncharacterized protein n=1 Tax=Lentinus tigrinus ALCF2SS1-6 TaxID=1328759 RepID=A0A5C2SMV9_9APHY|nr:hypothetical protein L227DRAFT_649356 [Lentinus tigrinus ALCF2SS1-6]RPD79418.1 hypothetical protein L226DRAFT_502003 [Lentinus tigrinus ALCF2SS1-7]
MADDRNSLTAYLAQAYLFPLFPQGTVPPLHQHAPLWPVMEELNCRPKETRDFMEVTEIPLLAVENAVRTYFMGFENKLRVEWPNSSLTMPCPDVKVLGNPALNHLKVKNEHDFHEALQYFMLNTTAEAIRTIEKQPFDEDELSFLRLRAQGKVNSRKICTLWLFGRPIGLPRVVSQGVVILSLPPWEFGPGDFQMFARPRKFARGELDREAPDGPRWNNAMKLWALTYDVCKSFGFKWFVVTTYNHWVFGTWSPNWTAVEVTQVLPFDKTRSITLVELLVFWTQSGRERVRYWQTAADFSR